MSEKYIEKSLTEEIMQERSELAFGRLKEIQEENLITGALGVYFRKTGSFLNLLHKIAEAHKEVNAGEMCDAALDQVLREAFGASEQVNTLLYEDIIGDHYETSFANPAYACKALGKEHGQLLCMLYGEIRGLISCAFEGEAEELLIFTELFLQIYGCYAAGTQEKEIKDILYWFFSDYSELFMIRRVRQQTDETYASTRLAKTVICSADLTDIQYLYSFGAYITEDERKTAEYLNSLPENEICRIASAMSEGYRKGFEIAGKDLSKKKTVQIRYHIGFERVIRQVISNFEKMGLMPTLSMAGSGSVCGKAGYEGADPNPQYAYDHRMDSALYLDKRYVERRLGVSKAAYEQYKVQARAHGGPACMDVFGEKPFAPVTKEEALKYSAKQQKLTVELASEASRITNQYIPGEERSFTIIAFPMPAIGKDYEVIFREMIAINTLDNELYREIQQTLIDALDQGEKVHVVGKGTNETDLTITLHPLRNPAKETIFENCLADVNIPVGEVFTSPVLEGTNGVLNVSGVYLDSLYYKNLKITFTDGMVTAYTCENFPEEEENQRYIKENVLHYHESLPMGEFAIGTNTTAYRMAGKYKIAARLPILVAEKMGPHFALGDTCYSHEEERTVYNPDGKEVIARENTCSMQRKENPAKAYFNTHVDITIPYEEVAKIAVVHKDGSETVLIEDGHFALPGTEALNKALT